MDSSIIKNLFKFDYKKKFEELPEDKVYELI